MDKFLDFLFKHNVLIIEGLFVFILLLISALAFYYFFSASKSGSSGAHFTGSDTDFEKLQVVLKQVLEKANMVTSSAAVATNSDSNTDGGSSSADSSLSSGSELGSQILNLQQEIGVLKDSLTQKQKEIETFKNDNLKKTEVPASADPNQAELEVQIKELQAKLTEYEIISQDIADLTMYKDENAKLKWELKKLKGESPAGEKTEETPPVVASAPAPAEVVDEAIVAPKAEPVAVPAVEEPSTPPADVPLKAVASDSVVESSVVQPTEASPAEASPANAEEVKGVVDDILMAEFAAAVEEQSKGKAINHNQNKAAEDPAKKETEESKIMDQFEKFVKKEGSN
jgi:hypothetical protein